MSHVLAFISRFTQNGKLKDVERCFTDGCCYWFARILYERFKDWGPVLMWDDVDKHFGTLIFDRVYDITGDANEGHQWQVWKDYRGREPKQAKMVWENCVRF